MNTRTSGPSPGTRLRGAREARGLTIEAAAERLRLNAALVLAMEEDRLALLGAPVFVRGHLRNYAALLGLPEEEILAAFGSGEIPEPSFLPAMDLRPKVRDHARWAWPITAVLLAIAVVAAFWWWGARF
ncbi:MAG: helix-turn-helix domain-containing protein [Gammaproteobacteria bacterium]|nr:helix-turn-helix domain-containing protein [Gammaproteobacteria bacterium]